MLYQYSILAILFFFLLYQDLFLLIYSIEPMFFFSPLYVINLLLVVLLISSRGFWLAFYTFLSKAPAQL